MKFDNISKVLSEKYNIESDAENQVIRLTSESMFDVCRYLFDNSDLLFDYLMCITSIDNQENGLELAYNLYSYKNRHYLEFRVAINRDEAVPSVESIWKTADWHEREAFDLMRSDAEEMFVEKRDEATDYIEGKVEKAYSKYKTKREKYKQGQ